MKKALFIAHHFPPIGGAGVQRSVKFVKHLSSFGFAPVVLTDEGRPGGRWKPEDQSLLADIPSGTPIHRVKENSTLDGPSPRLASKQGRYHAYLEAGTQVIRVHRPDVIVVTMSPFEDARIASTLSAQTQLPWVADLRDPWALDEVQIYRTCWHRRRERRRMENALASASSIILNTPEAARQFRRAFPALAARARICITNGYDAEDFQHPAPPTAQGKFTIVHSGYLHTETGLRQRSHTWWYKCLGRIQKGVEILPRSHFYLLKALDQWQQEDPTIRSTVRLVFIGVPTATDQALTSNSSSNALTEFTGYQEHAECVRRVELSNALFLPMHHVPLPRRATIVPGKTYEYMASRRPIVAAVPEGDARDFLTACGTARLCHPKDVAGMLEALKSTYQEWRMGTDITPRWNRPAVERFDRRCLTEALADELTAVIRDAACLRP